MDLSSLFSPPDVLGMRRVLVIQPHADDGEVGAGGTLARLVDSGAEVRYLTVADDRVGSRDPNVFPEELAALRVKEEDAAMEVLGIRSNHWLGWRDSEVLPTLQLREQMIREIRTFKPDLVMTMDPWLPYEAHPDHRNTGMMASEAAFLSTQPYVDAHHLREGIEPHEVSAVAYMGTARPNTFIDITDTFAKKLEAIRCHASQFIEEWDFYGTYFHFKAQQLAEEHGMSGGFAEAFKVLRPLHLHYNVDAESM